jgi:hypothetical protein
MNQVCRFSAEGKVLWFLLPFLLLVGATPCWADGDMSGLAVLIFWVAGIVGIVWLGFCAWLYYLLRRQPPWHRFGISAVVLVLPLLPFVTEIAGSWLHENLRSPLHQVSAEPTSLLGIDLPPGTQMDFEEEGRWGRTPVAARPPEPIRIGKLLVRAFRRSADNAIELELFGDQEVDGWRCLARSSTTLERVGDAWQLSACSIDVATIDKAEWPSGTLFQRQEKGFFLSWLNDPFVCAAECPALLWNGIPLSSMQGEYDTDRRLLAMSATTDNQEVKLGSFRFERWAKLQQSGSEAIEIQGKGLDTRDGRAVDCVTLNVKNKATHRCISPS